MALLTVPDLDREDVREPGSAGAYITPREYRPIVDESLCWAAQTQGPDGKPRNPDTISIYPGASRLVDLCGVGTTPIAIAIPSEVGWARRRAVLKGTNTYSFELKLFAQNVRFHAGKHSAKFTLAPSSDGSDITVIRSDPPGVTSITRRLRVSRRPG